jgi:hypothetical protein
MRSKGLPRIAGICEAQKCATNHVHSECPGSSTALILEARAIAIHEYFHLLAWKTFFVVELGA